MNAEFARRLSFVPEEHHDFFESIYETMCQAQQDYDVDEAILAGEWPDALNYITYAAEKLGYKLTPIDKD